MRRLDWWPIQCAEPTRKLLGCRAHRFRKGFDVRLDAFPGTRDTDSGNDFVVATEYRSSNPPYRRAPFSAVDRVAEAPRFSGGTQNVIGANVGRIRPSTRRAAHLCDLPFVTPSEERLTRRGRIRRRASPDCRVGSDRVKAVDFLDIDGGPILVGGVVRRLSGAFHKTPQQRKHFVAYGFGVECVAA